MGDELSRVRFVLDCCEHTNKVVSCEIESVQVVVVCRRVTSRLLVSTHLLQLHNLLLIGLALVFSLFDCTQRGQVVSMGEHWLQLRAARRLK